MATKRVNLALKQGIAITTTVICTVALYFAVIKPRNKVRRMKTMEDEVNIFLERKEKHEHVRELETKHSE